MSNCPWGIANNCEACYYEYYNKEKAEKDNSSEET